MQGYDDIKELMESNLLKYEKYLYKSVIERIVESAQGLRETSTYSWLSTRSMLDKLSVRVDRKSTRMVRDLKAYFLKYYRLLLTEVVDLEQYHEQCEKRYTQALTTQELHELILTFAERLGASGKDLKKDKKALKRHLDFEAIVDRYYLRRNELNKHLIFCINRIAYFSKMIHQSSDHYINNRSKVTVDQMFVGVTTALAETDVLVAVIKALVVECEYLASKSVNPIVSDVTIERLVDFAEDRHNDVWVVTESMRVLAVLDFTQFSRICYVWFDQFNNFNDNFIRQRIIISVGYYLQEYPNMIKLVDKAALDKSPFVRQSIAKVLKFIPEKRALEYLVDIVKNDPEKNTRSIAVMELPKFEFSSNFCESATKLLLGALNINETHYFARLTLKVIEDCFEKSRRLDKSRTKYFYPYHHQLVEAIIQFKNSANSFCARRYAAITLEALWCMSEDRLVESRNQLKAVVEQAPVGRKVKIDPVVYAQLSEHELGRLLALNCLSSYGLDIVYKKNAVIIRRGPQFKRRLWRIWYELFHPETDKRQGVLHTVGRVSYGNVRVPSQVMYEVSPTSVPGEPLLIEDERGWRPYLPLLDDFIRPLSGLYSTSINFFTSEGITKVVFPKNIFRRMKNFIKLSFKFPMISKKRVIDSGNEQGYSDYVNDLRRLKYKIEFEAHHYKKQSSVDDKSVNRFFNANGFLWLGPLWSDIKNYYLSIYGNTLFELGVFLFLFLAFLFGRHYLALRKIRRQRAKLSLCVGGWGTRGKSGVEHLKAAVFHSLGFKLASKITGSNAEILVSSPMKKLLNIPIYRPYDKATIWEQASTLNIAADLQVDVFMWECMAVKQRYTQQLQEQWMRDDYSTITNTFPDHEAQQGPAGHDVAKVIAEFIPFHSTLITSEVQLFPILKEVAKIRDTKLVHVNWNFGDTLPSTLIGELPYKENIANINLIVKLAETLEIPQDVTLKAIKDNLIADIGAFKVFPKVSVDDRSLLFVNSMSANERYSTVNNLHRINYFDQSLAECPNSWLVIVVNNRQDRIARSRAFSRMMANEVMCDQLIIMGTNQNGFLTYLKSDWRSHIEGMPFWVMLDEADPEGLRLLKQFALWLRIPLSDDIFLDRLAPLCEKLSISYVGLTPEVVVRDLCAALQQSDIVSHQSVSEIIQQLLVDFTMFQQALNMLGNDQTKTAMIRDHLMKLFDQCFFSKISIIQDKNATGDDINLHIIAKSLPLNLSIVVAVQNIKGPGLNLFYSWNDWLRCDDAMKVLTSDHVPDFKHALLHLSGLEHFSILYESLLLDVMTQCQSTIAKMGALEIKLYDKIILRLKASSTYTEKKGVSLSDRRLVKSLVNFVEDILEPGDSIRRRKKSNRIYKELAEARISYPRAASLLNALLIRQKGGWLMQWLKSKGL